MTQISTIASTSATNRLGSLSTDRPPPPPPTEGRPKISREQMDERFRDAAAAQGIDVAKLDGLKETIREKVQNVVQSGGDADDVQQAIDSVLEANDIDPTELRAKMQKAAESLGPPPGGPPPGEQGDGRQPPAGFDPATAIGSSALFGVDLGRLLAGETQGLSVDREA